MRALVAVDTSLGAAFVDTMLRVWDAGDALLPLDPRLPAPARDRLLAAMRPSAIVGADGERTALPDGVPVEAGDALVIATSGSTGEPKGAIHTHESVGASARATNAGVGADPATDRWLCCLPLSHVAGLSVVTRALTAGTSLHVLSGFDAHLVTAAARAGATLTTLVPTALARIDPTLFRRIVVGGTHPPADLPPNCLVSYGMTETGSAVAYDGRPLAGAEVRIVGRHGLDAPHGELLVRGPMVLRAYRTDDPAGADPRGPDGWFATGDVASWNDDGSFTVHGRDGELIITGGENVWPAEVERALATHPGVAEVAVIGRDDPEWGQRVVAVVAPTTPSSPPSLDELRGHCKQTLPAFAAPRAIELVDALPRTPLGKVARRKLASASAPPRV